MCFLRWISLELSYPNLETYLLKAVLVTWCAIMTSANFSSLENVEKFGARRQKSQADLAELLFFVKCHSCWHTGGCLRLFLSLLIHYKCLFPWLPLGRLIPFWERGRITKNDFASFCCNICLDDPVFLNVI